MAEKNQKKKKNNIFKGMFKELKKTIEDTYSEDIHNFLKVLTAKNHTNNF